MWSRIAIDSLANEIEKPETVSIQLIDADNAFNMFLQNLLLKN